MPMILVNFEGADQPRATLSAAFDDSSIPMFVAYNIGDGEAMSGPLVAGRRELTVGTAFLVFGIG